MNRVLNLSALAGLLMALLGAAPALAQTTTINGLPAATTPLNCSELSPIWQSARTVKLPVCSGAVPFAGTTAPAAPVPFQHWIDTSTTPNVERLYDGAQWLALWTVDTAGHVIGLPITASANTWTGTQTFSGPTVGGTLGGGTGMIGIGTGPHSGYGLIIQPPAANLLSGEILLLDSTAASNPTGTVASGTGVFGAVLNGSWGGSIDNRANGLVYGSQNEAFVSGSASVLNTYGTESAGVFSTSGTVVQGTGVYNHIENQGIGTVADAWGEEISIGNTGGGTITRGYGINILGLHATTVHAINIVDQTFGASNYAIYTGLGLVHFGDALDAPTATIPSLLHSVTLGVGGLSGTGSTLTVNAPADQGSNLLDLKLNGVSQFSINSAGQWHFSNDQNLSGTTLITDSTQSMRISGSSIAANSATTMGWSSTTHAYDTIDTSTSRSSSGVVAVGINNTPGNTGGSLKYVTYIASGSAPTLSGTCTTGSQTGANTAGTFTATCAAQTVIITFATTAPTGWKCTASDQTTPADTLNQTANSSTSCTLTGTTAAADRIIFEARAF